MAKARMINRRISNSNKVSKLKTHEARLLYTWLIPFTDQNGNYEADPRTLKGHIFTKIEIFEKEIAEYILDIAEVGLIKLYFEGSQLYLHITDFELYNKISHPEKTSLPEPNTKNIILPKNLKFDNNELIPIKIRQNDDFGKSGENSGKAGKIPENSGLSKCNVIEVNLIEEKNSPVEESIPQDSALPVSVIEQQQGQTDIIGQIKPIGDWTCPDFTYYFGYKFKIEKGFEYPTVIKRDSIAVDKMFLLVQSNEELKECIDYYLTVFKDRAYTLPYMLKVIDIIYQDYKKNNNKIDVNILPVMSEQQQKIFDDIKDEYDELYNQDLPETSWTIKSFGKNILDVINAFKKLSPRICRKYWQFCDRNTYYQKTDWNTLLKIGGGLLTKGSEQGLSEDEFKVVNPFPKNREIKKILKAEQENKLNKEITEADAPDSIKKMENTKPGSIKKWIIEMEKEQKKRRGE